MAARRQFLLHGLLESSPYLRSRLLFGKRRQFSVHPINVQRESFGEYHHLSDDLKEDADRFHSYYKMYPPTFSVILDIVREDLEKQTTSFGKPISAEERLTLTLR